MCKYIDFHFYLPLSLSICFAFCLSLCVGCDSLSSPKDAVQVANACVEAELISACPVGTSPNLNAQAEATCNSSGSVHIETIQESGGSQKSLLNAKLNQQLFVVIKYVK